MTTPSLTRRLVVVLTAGAAALWLLGAVATFQVLRNTLQSTLEGGLRETAERLLPLAIDGLSDDADGDSDPATYDRPTDGGRDELVVYQVRSASRVLLRSHDAPLEPFAAPLVEGFATASPWRIYTTSDQASGLFIQVAELEERRDRALWSSAAALLLPLILLIPIGAFGIRLAVRSGLAPLRRLGDELARRDIANLAPTGMRDTPRELGPVVEAIDGLLERLRAAFAAERTLAANSAHELRTPIAGSLAQTQRLVEELTGHPARERALRVEESLHRLSGLAAKLLALSRAEAGFARTTEAIDLLPAARLVVDDASREDQGDIELLVAAAELPANIDIDAFGIVLRNLIDNARLHGAAGHPVLVAIRRDAIEVTSAGPTVPADVLAQLAQPFARGNTVAPGSGLGLAIVETIMRQAGGRLDLLSPGIGRNDGFTARLVFAA